MEQLAGATLGFRRYQADLTQHVQAPGRYIIRKVSYRGGDDVMT